MDFDLENLEGVLVQIPKRVRETLNEGSTRNMSEDELESLSDAVFSLSDLAKELFERLLGWPWYQKVYLQDLVDELSMRQALLELRAERLIYFWDERENDYWNEWHDIAGLGDRPD